MRTKYFKIQIGINFKDLNRDITIIDREHRINKNHIWKWYKYKCNKCGWNEGWIVESSLLNGTGCSCCCLTPRIVVEGINDIPTTASWMVKFFQGGYDEAKLYNKSSNKKIKPICPDCKSVKDSYITINRLYNERSISCKYCGDNFSYPNKIMFNILTQLEIEFISEYCPKWISPKRYDFYFELNNKKYIIEMDGIFHYSLNLMNNTTEYESQKLDKYKDALANENGIDVYRIDSIISDVNYIKNNIINSNLNKIINLENIDWNKCGEFALTNLCKKACILRNEGMSAFNISNMMKINRGTIIKYLKQGAKLGWCDYNPEEEMIKSGKLTGKKVKVIKDDIVLGIYDSCNDIQLNSESIFGKKLYRSGISEVCNGIRNSYKGYIFKYVK